MGLLPKTGGRHVKVRLLKLSIFLLLSFGAVSMLIPFGLMLSGSTRSGVDLHEFSLIPRFMRDDERLFQKYIEGRYNESPANLRAAWGRDFRSFEELKLHAEPVDVTEVQDWFSFLEKTEVPSFSRFCGFVYTPVSKGRPLSVRGFMQMLLRRYDGSIAALNADLGTDFQDWNAFRILPPDTRGRLGYQPPSPLFAAWEAYMQTEAPEWTLGVYHLEGYYHERVTRVLSGRDAEWQHLSDVPPEGDENWELFVREVVHPGALRLAGEHDDLWQDFLQARYIDLESLNDVTGLKLENWEELSLPRSIDAAGNLSADWLALVAGWQEQRSGRVYRMPMESLRLRSPDLLWRAVTGSEPPMEEVDRWLFDRHRDEIRKTFLLQNYAAVWEILIVHGRGLWVTVVYCAGAVLIALIVNPLAAYALSRFRPKNTYALLLYLLLTMAFPPMVTQIPLFLMLRDLQLLNTFWALLLPGMAHGYSIFLLKGFFDSLPRELYESASLDGAGELRMFGVITLSLSKPILAVIALNAFVNAYTAFMFALLICQDESMWTLMVWLYQLQQQYGPGMMNAAFVLAALPTLLVFLLAQRQILRGIVVPSEK